MSIMTPINNMWAPAKWHGTTVRQLYFGFCVMFVCSPVCWLYVYIWSYSLKSKHNIKQIIFILFFFSLIVKICNNFKHFHFWVSYQSCVYIKRTKMRSHPRYVRHFSRGTKNFLLISWVKNLHDGLIFNSIYYPIEFRSM